MLVKPFNIFLLILMHLFCMQTTYADVYKWVDDNGKVVYGDKPTTNNADKIKIKNAPQKDQQYLQRVKKQQKLLDVMQEERDTKTALKKEEKEKKVQQEIKCAEVSKELEEMKTVQLLYEDTDDPDNPKFISAEERKIEESKYDIYIKENC
jgi:Domain of unknown function (DUF4124)